jgi:hypothetical protein
MIDRIGSKLTQERYLENPLLQSSLALSGANAFDVRSLLLNKTDGILTAEDISAMDLTKTELVVLFSITYWRSCFWSAKVIYISRSSGTSYESLESTKSTGAGVNGRFLLQAITWSSKSRSSSRRSATNKDIRIHITGAHLSAKEILTHYH